MIINPINTEWDRRLHWYCLLADHVSGESWEGWLYAQILNRRIRQAEATLRDDLAKGILGNDGVEADHVEMRFIHPEGTA